MKNERVVWILKVKNVSAIFIIVIGIIVAYIFLQQKEYTTLSDLEVLFQKHEISYGVLPVKEEYRLGTAKEQNVYLHEDIDINVNIVDE